ncbi:hypothetical protein N7470_000401 [Penicillium chermesinum]|nr:hypothetical protein N7470_000401 [Penicillium chermesinum]
MADELDYLQADFDLNSLTVPRLRSILVNHDIPYPASAKKSQLIQILEHEVLPQARRLLRERERVRRTSEGITDMGSRGSSVVSDREDRDSIPPPPTPSTIASTAGTRRGTTRRSTRASTADTDNEVPPATPATVKRKSAARSVGKHPRASDTEINDDAATTPTAAVAASARKSTARKTRRSEDMEGTTPSIKTEPREGSIFTDDNPFQSGSPESVGRPVSRDSKRKSGSRLSVESSGSRTLRSRRSVTPGSGGKQEDGIKAPTRASFDFASRLQATKEEPESEDEESEVDNEDEEDGDEDEVPGEEFTPEEQLALESEQYAPPTRTRKHSHKQSSTSVVASWVVILSVLIGFAAWWRKEKIEIGYCGLGKPTWSLAETKVPEWANVLEPLCEPCPPHAFCYPNFEARCEHDFILKAHPLSLGGIVPLPPTCEPDSEKARRVKAVADKAVEELRERRAKYECGQLENEREPTPEIPEPKLKEQVAKKRRKGLSDTEFDDLWKGAIGEIIDKDEVVSTTTQPSAVLILSSTSTARLPFTCAARRYVRLALLAYRLPISLLVLTACGLMYARSLVRARRSDLARVPELVATTLDRLATQAALHACGGAPEPYIPIGQLRDDVLRFELQGKRREELWARVRRFVEGNANVRAAVREGRSGDVSRVWEWIGGISSVGPNGHVDDFRGSARRGSARLSWSSPLNNVENAQQDTPTPTHDDSTTNHRQSRRWDEGRPIY